jgi:hypothetical protein
VATPLTIVTTPSSTVGLSADSRGRDSAIRRSYASAVSEA